MERFVIEKKNGARIECGRDFRDLMVDGLKKAREVNRFYLISEEYLNLTFADIQAMMA